ncbi:MAG: hypothetical protein M3Y45_04680 [Actinomycetota bacterium]|nr:hypothetical protein [Actinomycetota bacterium]
MAYVLTGAVLLFIALLVAASPLLAVVIVIPLVLIYFGLMAAVRRSDRQRGTDETPSGGAGPSGPGQSDRADDREVGPLPPP